MGVIRELVLFSFHVGTVNASSHKNLSTPGGWVQHYTYSPSVPGYSLCTMVDSSGIQSTCMPARRHNFFQNSISLEAEKRNHWCRASFKWNDNPTLTSCNTEQLSLLPRTLQMLLQWFESKTVSPKVPNLFHREESDYK